MKQACISVGGDRRNTTAFRARLSRFLDAELASRKLRWLGVGAVLSMSAAQFGVPPALAMDASDIVRMGIQIIDQSTRAQRGRVDPQPLQVHPRGGRRQPGRSVDRAPAPIAVPEYQTSLVREVQQTLNRLGYSAGTPDGLMGPKTRAAIRAYQRDTHLPQTGLPDEGLMTALRAATPHRLEQTEEASGQTRPAAGTAGSVALFEAAHAGSFAALPGFDLPLGDYRSGLDDPALSGISAEACLAACSADSRCLSFTYNTTNAICILKETVPEPARFAGAVSGIKIAAMEGSGPDQSSSELREANAETAMPAMVVADAADVTGAAGGEPKEPGAPALPPVAQAQIPEGLPQWRGRLLLAGSSSLARPDGSSIETADEAFGRMAVATVVRKYPELLDSDDVAEELFHFLDPEIQGRLAAEANVPPVKVVDKPFWYDLDEFEIARMFRVIRERVPALLLKEAPSMPIPALVLCAQPPGEYDFERQSFPLGANCNPTGPNSWPNELAGIFMQAPMPGGRLPDELPVPVNEAEAYKHEHFEALQSVQSVFDREKWYVIAGVAVRITDVVKDRDRGGFRVEIEPEQMYLFRNDRMETPFATLDIIPPPSLATVSAEPTGPLPVDEDTLALLMLKRGIVDLDDEAFRNWTSERIWKERIWKERPGEQRAWAAFFARGVPQDLSAEPEDLSAELVRSFADWTRARAEALPDPAPLIANSQQFAQMATEEGRNSVYAFDPVHKDDSRALSKRLAMPADRLSDPTGRFMDEAPGIGPIENIVLVLPAPVDSYVVQLDVTPEERDELDVIVTARLEELRIDRGGDGDPLLVLEVEPLSARVVRSDGDAKGQEIGSAQFDSLPKPAEPAEMASEPQPLGAEVADLLRVRYLPETVDDQILMRMMLSRFAYEAAAPEPVIGGHFFRNLSKEPPLEEIESRLPEFRKWEEARAAELPDRLTVTLELSQGTASYEGSGADTDLRGMCNTVHMEEDSGEPPTEKDEANRRVCRFLEAAAELPDPILFLKSLGPRADCWNRDPYCMSIEDAREQAGLPANEGVRDLVRLDRLPVLDRDALEAMEKELKLELVLSPTGAELTEAWPESVYRSARRRAAAFAEKYGARGSAPSPMQPPGPTFIFDAKLLGARVLDAETGEVVAEPELAAPTPPPFELLALDEETPSEWNILGIHLGDSFEEAEAAIREHMAVGRILVADREFQTASLTGAPRPFGSARMYLSEAEDEAIAIFDEPPAAAGKVLGIWRVFHLPHGSLEPRALAASLTQRYGEPIDTVKSRSSGEPVFLWSRFRPGGPCQEVSAIGQPDRWRGADGAPADPPKFSANGHVYPDLWSSYHGLIMEDGRRMSLPELCPLVLGVRYRSDPRTDQMDDELVTWLVDVRRYGELYFKGRDMEAEGASDNAAQILEPATDIGVKF